MPTPVIQAGYIPTMFEPAVEQEYFTQKISGVPEIIFPGTSANGEFHCYFLISLILLINAQQVDILYEIPDNMSFRYLLQIFIDVLLPIIYTSLIKVLDSIQSQFYIT